jgi:hypothetical protein
MQDIILLLLASFLIKTIFLNMPLSKNWTEFAIFMVGAVLT